MRGLSLHRSGWRWQQARGPLPQRRCKSSARTVQLTDLTSKWQPLWEKLESSSPTPRAKSKSAYILPMFPYPSGTLHLGHLRVYTISDVLARFKHMQGYDVLHPIGWDAFGLPAENAAIERGVHPAEWTQRNIEAMKKQMMVMGGLWSWDKEFQTCDPDFYKHTQRIFLMLLERGLAYQAESLVNWDPVDQTVLANEQVDANGCSWRSGAKVEKKMLKQWFLKIKEFQKPLLEDLDTLAENNKWPDRVLAMQKNWIGRSVGTKLWFDIESVDLRQETRERDSAKSLISFKPVDVFTTRADTLFGVMYVALSLNHPIVRALAENDGPLRDFLARAEHFPPDTKEGWLLQGVQAINPIAHLVQDEQVKKPLPIYVAPYVLDDYGSGAVMGVPAHDARDYAFWRQNQSTQPARHVVAPEPRNMQSSSAPSWQVEDKPMLEKGFLDSPDPAFNGLASDQAIEEIIDLLNRCGRQVEQTENWRLRDWLISRQRYWGTPIPVVHCNSCGTVPVPEHELPVKLPDLPASYFRGRSGNPLAEDEEWKQTMCPTCHGPAERETDTMDTFMDSSWYFFRFLDAKNKKSLVDPAKVRDCMPVDVYIGGVEHAILHLLYARFISKFLATTEYWPAGKEVLGEPFRQLITQGMVHGKTYSDPATGRFLRPEEVDLSKPSRPVIKGTDIAPKLSFEKMSKSKYNGVDPGATIAKYGADATRAHMLFQAPVTDVLEWDEEKITGVSRWLIRVLRLSTAFSSPDQDLKKFKTDYKIDEGVIYLLRNLRDSGMLNVADTATKDPDHSQRATLEVEKALIAALTAEEVDLLSKVQSTITSVTKAYSETYSLNTVISDLMTLTNTIWDTPHVSSCSGALKWYSTVHLLRMLAPVAPGVAEEAWHTLHDQTNSLTQNDQSNPPRLIRADSGSSIFAFGFPTADLSVLPLLKTSTTTCVVQIEGKRKFQVDINEITADTSKSDQVLFILHELLSTELGHKFLGKETGAIWKMSHVKETDSEYPQLPKGWKAIVVKNGRLVNFVGPKRSSTQDAKKS